MKLRRQPRKLGYDANSSNGAAEGGTVREAGAVVIHGVVAVEMIEIGTLVALGDAVDSDAVVAARRRRPATGTVPVAGEVAGILMCHA